MTTVLILVALAAQPAAGPPPTMASEVMAALADVQRLPIAEAQQTRYLTIYSLPADRQAEAAQVLAFWANSLSQEADLIRPRRVSATLYAVRLLDYGWDAKTWEKLADADPYFHVRLKFQVGQKYNTFHPGGSYGNYGQHEAGWYREVATKEVEVAALSPWLPEAEARELSLRTLTAVPIVRGDWWLVQTASQAGRKGTGYYDWFALKKRADFELLVALDVKASQRVKREVAGIVARSGVANLPRQIFRFQSVTGGYWVTRDALTDNKDARNAMRQLDGDFKHEAEEHVGHLPNGLQAFYLSDAAGKQQDTAPDTIGPDTTAPGRDKRIHVGISCVRCHEGLRPIRDWGRAVYSGPLALTSPDPLKLQRLRQLYLGELQESFEDDLAGYAKRIKRLNGLTAAENAKAMGVLWAGYAEADILPADAALMLGVSEADYLAAIRRYAASNPLADAVLLSHLADQPQSIRIDDWEQLMPIVGQLVRP